MAQPSFRYSDIPYQQSLCTQVAKAGTAVTAGGSLLVLGALVLTGTVICLTAVTPLFVIFSPVLVPAVMGVGVLSIGFLVSGGLGVMAMTVLAWIYRYVSGKHLPGAHQLDTARHMLFNKAREIKDYGHHQISGGALAS
ncbi:oleosin 1-like [Vigna unguiculata]|uniref:Oleosin n=1 Tax=Vigna unguiculata TaxID=3917 RepID=A0A4D6N4D4_VIGUN|nr:oleosin 1-like [Vigna unguiculata]QCE07762.1 Oleosin [Vigna unguiculata]